MCSGQAMFRSVCLTLTRKFSRSPLNLPVSGGSLIYSTIPSRTQRQNCFGETHRFPPRQITFADRLLVLAMTDYDTLLDPVAGIPSSGAAQIVLVERDFTIPS